MAQDDLSPTEMLEITDRDRAAEMAAILLRGIATYLIESGELDPSLPSDELRTIFWTAVKRAATDGDVEFYQVIDHQDSILEAADLLKDTHPEIYVVLIATWVEHWLNRAISMAVLREGNHSDTAIDVIRSSNMNSKLGGAIWRLLKLPDLETDTLKLMRRIIEFRNGFVHYKWQLQDVEDDSSRDEARAVMEAVPRLVEELDQVRQDIVMPSSQAEVFDRLFSGGIPDGVLDASDYT